MQARQLSLPPPPPPARALTRPAASPAPPSSLLLEPSSGSLALMLSDSSLLLYPSLPSPFASSPNPPPPRPSTAVPLVSSAACFLRLVPSPPRGRKARVLFLTAAPRGSDVALQAWRLAEEGFVRERLSLGKGEAGKMEEEVVLDLRHGFKVRMCGSVNVFAVYSAIAGKVWVLGARVAGEGREGVEVMKCAVVDCTVPVYSFVVFGELMMLGEVGGVRVFPLRPLVKGKGLEKKETQRTRTDGKGHGGSSTTKGIVKVGVLRDMQKKKRLPNGVVAPVSAGIAEDCVGSCPADCVLPRFKEEEASEVQQKRVNKEQTPIKHRTLKIKQTSGDGAFFVEFKSSEARQPDTKRGSVSSLKAVAIYALAQRKFLVLDSIGDIHMLMMQNAVTSDVTSTYAMIKHVDYLLKVQMLAVLPDLSSESQIAWISDGSHSLHVVSLSDLDASIDENKDEGKENHVHISVTDAIFTAEKIQDIVPFAANAVLLLAQVLLITRVQYVAPALEVMNYLDFLVIVKFQVYGFQQTSCVLKGCLGLIEYGHECPRGTSSRLLGILPSNENVVNV